MKCEDLVVVRGGVEPPTFRFSGGRSYQLSYLTSAGHRRQNVHTAPLTRAVLTGFEPATSTLTGWRALLAALQDHAALTGCQRCLSQASVDGERQRANENTIGGVVVESSSSLAAQMDQSAWAGDRRAARMAGSSPAAAPMSSAAVRPWCPQRDSNPCRRLERAVS